MGKIEAVRECIEVARELRELKSDPKTAIKVLASKVKSAAAGVLKKTGKKRK